MTGVSYMIPFVVAGGLMIAIAFAARGIRAYDPTLAADGSTRWCLRSAHPECSRKPSNVHRSDRGRNHRHHWYALLTQQTSPGLILN